MSSYRVPRALHNGFDEHSEHEVIELRHNGLDEVLAAVRQTAVELIAQSPQPPSTLTVRADSVAVEITWATVPTVPGAVVAPPVAAANDAGGDGNVLTASTVGVFYRASSPGAAPFVKEGDHVVPGQQVAIIEAMKLMLPVEADRPGEVVEVLVTDGESVEFGQPLFRLAPVED